MFASSKEVLSFSPPTSITKNAQLHIKGRNYSTEQRILVIRIDDRKKPSYAQRVNIERTLPAGDFNIQLSLAGLHTPTGRRLNREQLHQIIAFSGDGSDAVHIESMTIHSPRALPDEVFAWDLGPADSALWPGFTALTPDSNFIHGRRLIKAIDRSSRKQASEALTCDGIRGIKTLRLPLPNGRWSITLWIRDPGEWEHLPHPLIRHIEADGHEIWSQQFTSEDWIKQVYLAGRAREATAEDDAWTLFGKRTEGLVSFMADVSDNELNLTFSGEQPDAGFVAAILAEPGEEYYYRNSIEKQRATWWRNNWRVEDWPEPTTSETSLQALQQKVTAAAGTNAYLRFDMMLKKASVTPMVYLSAPTLADIQLKTQLRWGQWLLKRSGISATSLLPSNHYLRGGTVPKQGDSKLPRRLHITVTVPEGTPAGRYQGRLSVSEGADIHHQQIVIDVPEVTLPPLDRPIGVYLERPVHFNWFDKEREKSAQALQCDIEFLRSLGMTGIAPPLTTPVSEQDTQRFIEEIRRVSASGFLSPIFAYSPFKRLENALGIEAALARIHMIDKTLAMQGLPLPVWATADEPSNPWQKYPVDTIRRYAGSIAPASQFGGQLNNPHDENLIDSFNIILINHGYGIDENRISSIKKNDISPWLYNMPNLRAAAGFYLWRIGADGYLQWHARMPTADPFDLTDGREDDVQFLFPMSQSCPTVHDVDVSIFDISEGITDMRWLLWLQSRAEQDAEAKQLLKQLHDEVPDSWHDMETIPAQQLQRWRKVITDLVRF